MSIPPVFIQLGKSLPGLLLKPALLYATLTFLQHSHEFEVPTWAVVISLFLVNTVSSKIYAIYVENKRERDAAASNAVPVKMIDMTAWQAVGAMRKSFLHSLTPIDLFQEWTEKYGNTFRTPMLSASENRVFTIEPDHIKAILAAQFPKFVKGPVVHDQFESLLGDGVFNADGQMWKFHRDMTRHFFTRDRISDFDNFDRHSTSVINLMKSRFEQGHPIDFQDAIGRFTLDSATEYLYGRDVCSLDAGLPYPPKQSYLNTTEYEKHPSNMFVQSFAEAQMFSSMRARSGALWRLFETWKDEVKPLRDNLNEYVKDLIDEGLKRREEKTDNDEEGQTLLDHLLRDSSSNVSIIQDELINMLVAGRDTTAGTLSWALYMLAEHPEITKRLREEVLSHVGSERRPAYEDLREMKFLRAFVNETLRLFPAVPLNGRRTTEAVLLPSKNGEPPYYVPSGTICSYSVFLMHRRKDLWGPDADEFDPNRFLDSRAAEYLTPNPYIFVPFNAGPRICLGQQFAYNEMEFFLVRLLQSFENFDIAWDAQPATSTVPKGWIKTDKSEKNIGYVAGLTMAVKDGLWMRMTPSTEA